jgi:hypothetical protein
LLDAHLGVGAIAEPLQREVLVAELAVERFVGAILPGFARIDKRRLDLGGLQPAQNRGRDKFRPIVGAKVARPCWLLSSSTPTIGCRPQTVDAC